MPFMRPQVGKYTHHHAVARGCGWGCLRALIHVCGRQGLKATTSVARTGSPIRYALTGPQPSQRSADRSAATLQHAGTPLLQDPELLNALVAYLFGEAHVDLISHSDLQAFLQALLVANPTITTFGRLW